MLLVLSAQLAMRGKRPDWNLIAVQSAVEAVRNKEMGFLKASNIFKELQSTLKDYINHINHKTKQVTGLLKMSLGRKCVLLQDAEDQIVDYYC
jgi:hypothetical protein